MRYSRGHSRYFGAIVEVWIDMALRSIMCHQRTVWDFLQVQCANCIFSYPVALVISRAPIFRVAVSSHPTWGTMYCSVVTNNTLFNPSQFSPGPASSAIRPGNTDSSSMASDRPRTVVCLGGEQLSPEITTTRREVPGRFWCEFSTGNSVAVTRRPLW
jgi:hypothetical protein